MLDLYLAEWHTKMAGLYIKIGLTSTRMLERVRRRAEEHVRKANKIIATHQEKES